MKINNHFFEFYYLLIGEIYMNFDKMNTKKLLLGITISEAIVNNILPFVPIYLN
jgi:hypothetical protein